MNGPASIELPEGPSVWVQEHWHDEPVCAYPDCTTYLTQEQMRARREASRS